MTRIRDDRGSLESRIGESVPKEVRKALLALSSEELTDAKTHPSRLAPPKLVASPVSGLFRTSPQDFASWVASMDERRILDTRKTLHDALEREVAAREELLSATDVLKIVATAETLLDILLARSEELARRSRERDRSDAAARRRARSDAEPSREKGSRGRGTYRPSGSTTSDGSGAQKPKGHSQEKHIAPAVLKKRRERRRVQQGFASKTQNPQSSGGVITRLYRDLDKFKMEVRYLSPEQKRSLGKRIEQELDSHRRRAVSFVRPDDTRQRQAMMLLAILDPTAYAVTKRWSPPPSAVPVKRSQGIYQLRGRPMSGGLPSLGKN